MMTSLDAHNADLAKARKLLSEIETTLEGTGFAITATKALTAEMVPALERLAKLAAGYAEGLRARGVEHDAAALLEQTGLLLERPPASTHVAALDSWKAILGPDASDPLSVPESGKDASATVPRSVRVALERAQESISGLEDEVEALSSELTQSLKRIDDRLNVMLTGPRPDMWSSTTEGYELQVLLLLELRFAANLEFDPNNGVRLNEKYSEFLRLRFPDLGCRPLSAITSDFAVMRQALAAFRGALVHRYFRADKSFTRLASAAAAG